MNTEFITLESPVWNNPVNDETVRAYIRRIQNSKRLSNDEKYSLLDSLSFLVINNHSDGIAARVLDEISKAIAKLQEGK